MSVIEINNLSKIFGYADATTVALDDVDLSVEQGEFVIIMGPSGSGKTTLMNIIGLLDQATHGNYLLDGQSVVTLGSRRKAKTRRDKIGFIFQSASLLPRLNVIDNVALPLAYRGVMQGKRRQQAMEILNELEIGERAYYHPNQLSGGQLQRAGIARSLINQPSLILADEPTGNLDSDTTTKIMKRFQQIHRQGNTIVMVTHNQELTQYADRVIMMRDGRIVSDSLDINTIELPEDAPSEVAVKSSKKSKKSKKSSKIRTKTSTKRKKK